ncbi:hypothetical protein P8936_10745 [Edaphobacter paludis]
MVAGITLAMSSGIALAAQSGGPNVAAKPAEVSFQFERVGLPVPRFTLRVEEDGSGSYQAEEIEGAADGRSLQYASAKHIDRTLNLTSSTVGTIFKAARELNRFDMDCAANAKKVADTGKKTLSYKGTDGSGSCTYNYSNNKDVEKLTTTFIGIALTLDEGRRLAFLHQYDRLGLDAEMTIFERETAAGHALELNTIAPVLTAIAGDNAVMERVRLEAANLLKLAGSNKI